MAVTALIALVGGVLWFLFNRGEQLDDRSAAGRQGGTTTFAVPSLRGNIDLPGSWVTDNAIAEELRQAVLDVAEGTIRTDVSARKGFAFFSIVSAPNRDPASILESNVQEEPMLQRDEEGNAVTVSASKRVVIGTRDAVLTEIEVKRATGEQVYRRRLWVVDARDQVVFIEAVAAPTKPSVSSPASTRRCPP